MLILIPCPLRHLHAFTPSRVVGSFTTTCSCQLANSWPSRHIVPESVPTTSTLTGPPTILQISRIAGLNGLPSLAMSDGLVVTPSRIPSAAASRISLIFPVSRKSFIAVLSQTFKNAVILSEGGLPSVVSSLGNPSRRILVLSFR